MLDYGRRVLVAICLDTGAFEEAEQGDVSGRGDQVSRENAEAAHSLPSDAADRHELLNLCLTALVQPTAQRLLALYAFFDKQFCQRDDAPQLLHAFPLQHSRAAPFQKQREEA